MYFYKQEFGVIARLSWHEAAKKWKRYENIQMTDALFAIYLTAKIIVVRQQDCKHSGYGSMMANLRQ